MSRCPRVSLQSENCRKFHLKFGDNWSRWKPHSGDCVSWMMKSMGNASETIVSPINTSQTTNLISSPKGFCRVHTALFPPQPLIDNSSKFPQEVFVVQLKILINQTAPAVASLRQFWICARLYWKITVLLSLLWEKSGRGVRKLLLASPATPPLLFVSCTW